MKQKLKQIETKIKESKVLRKVIGGILMVPGVLLAISLIGLFLVTIGIVIWTSKGFILLVTVVIIGGSIGIVFLAGYGYDLMVMTPIKKTGDKSNKKKNGKINKNVRNK